MSQKTLVLALAAILLILLVAAGIAVGGGSLGLFGADDPRNNGRAQRAAANADPEQAEFEDNIAGSDEHGPFRVGQGGTRVYRDEQGRFFVISPDGKRVFTDAFGRPRNSSRGGREGSGTSGNSGNGAGTGNAAGDDERKPAETPAEEEPKPASLSGQVQDDTGAPFAGAAVVAEIAGGGQRTATSGDEGQFAFADLPSGLVIQVFARDTRGNFSKTVTTKLAAGATKLPAPLVLPRDTSIRGIVRSAENGSVLAGASVILYEGAGAKVKSSLSTGGDGNFEFAKLLPAAYRVQVSREGFAPRIFNSVEPPRDLDVQLEPGAAISGRVTDTGGAPLANARVACDFTAEPAQHFHTEAFTDSDGFYSVKCQPESQHNTLKVVAAGFKSASKTFVRSGAGDVNFMLEATDNVVLRGRLLSKAGGAPVTVATFSAYTAEPKAVQVFQSVGPGADGTFWVEVGTAGVEVRIRSSGLAELRVSYAPVPGEAVELGALYMDAGYAVFGVIRESAEGKKPIAGANVSVGSAKVTTGEDGKYRIEGLGAEPFIVRVLHAAYLGSAVNVAPTPGVHEVEQDIELGKANFEARVLVKDAATGGPLAGVKATVVAYGQVLTSGEDGLVKLTGLSSLKIDVKFEKAGYATVNQQVTADVAEKVAAAPPQEVVLTRGSTVHGTCTSNGSPLPAASKVEVWDTAKLVVTVLTDTEGKYTTESLPWGVYFVGLPDHGVAPRAIAVDEEGGKLDLEIGAISHMRGKLLRADGQPHANAGVYLYRRENVYWSATFHTDPDGRYEVMNLWPGEYVFCALKSQGDVAAQFAVKATVTAAGWNTVDVNLPQITGVMTGRVTYTSGEPVKGARVSVTNVTANFERALLAAYVVTDNDGNYRAERLENGFNMIARVGGYPDEAVTGTAFSEVVAIPSGSDAVTANIVVASSGLDFGVKFRRADNGPINAGPLCYLFDSQGRMAGLFFGGGTFLGNIPLHDVVPGSYTLVATFRGFKRASLNFTVGASAPANLEILIEPEDRNPG